MVDTFNVEPTVPLATGVIDAGDRPQVTVGVAGAIAQVNATARLNPFNEVTVIVEAALLPAMITDEAGEGDKLKSFRVRV